MEKKNMNVAVFSGTFGRVPDGFCFGKECDVGVQSMAWRSCTYIYRVTSRINNQLSLYRYIGSNTL